MTTPTTVRSGLDRVAAGHQTLPRSARIALLTNRATRTLDGRWALDALQDAGYRVQLLLVPEHGLELAADAGAPISHGALGDLPVLSLYGADRTPIEEALTEVDLIVADLPDVGARYYTYPWTIRETMRLAARHQVPVVILDRPNPLGGVAIEGNLPEIDSAVCSAAVTIRHGLTLGELSLWNRRYHAIDVEIDVIPVSDWQRAMPLAQTGVPWVPASPALSDLEAVALYPGTCLLEGTTISEGRGTNAPFRQFGSPNLNPELLIETLRGDEALDGVELAPERFTPTSSKWTGQECLGVRITIADDALVRSVRAGLAIIGAVRRTPDFQFLPFFDQLAGTHSWRQALERGAHPTEITDGFAPDEEKFRKARQEILLYQA